MHLTLNSPSISEPGVDPNTPLTQRTLRLRIPDQGRTGRPRAPRTGQPTRLCDGRHIVYMSVAGDWNIARGLADRLKFYPRFSDIRS